MFKAVFSFLNSTVRTLGAIGGGIVMFIEYDWITSEYIIEGYNFLFMTHFDTAQIVFGSIFGLAGFFKFIDTD